MRTFRQRVKNKKHHLFFLSYFKKIRMGIIFIVGIGFLLVFFISGGFVAFKWLKSFIEQKVQTEIISEISKLNQEKDISSAPQEQLQFASFGDTFSGVGWLNQEATTLYQDKNTTAFTFPPKFKWERVSALNFSGKNPIIDVKQDSSISFCIKNRCVIQKEFELYFSEKNAIQPLTLPVDLQNLELVNISLGILESKWLLGAVVQSEGFYRAFIFSFDGSSFTKIFDDKNTPFVSLYKGIMGFGGEDQDWLAVYGGYEGILYRFVNNQTQGLSKLLGIRPMDGGFEPAVLKVKFKGVANWYIFSLTSDKPKLIKLFQNDTEEIVGSLDLTKLLSLQDFSRALFQRWKDNELIAKVNHKGIGDFWKFTDEGFDKSRTLEIASLNLNNYPAEIRAAEFSDLALVNDKSSINFFLSNDGKNWESISFKGKVEFKNPEGRYLFWRAIFSPDNNSQTSPFLSYIDIYYALRLIK